MHHRTFRSPALGLAIFSIAAALTLGACGTPAPPDDEGTDTAVADTGSADVGLDAGGGDAGTGDAAEDTGGGDTGTADTGATDAGTTDDTGTTDAGTTDAGGDPDTAGTDADDAGTVDAGPPPKKLPLPDCAKNCAECSKCPDTPMCLDGKSYNNDCEAICELQAYDWPTGVEPSQGKCPECSACKPDSPKEDWCATLKNGAKLTVKTKCETECLELATDVGVNPTKGPCKSKCSFPADQGGGGCSPTAYQPVCSKKDGITYQTSCAMQNCDLQGCFAIGENASTAQCTPGLMVAECPGECYDSSKWSACPQACAPVCAIAPTGKAQSYRNGCIATTENAKVLSCTGVSTTTKDKCSAELYATIGAGCCPDVDYTSVKQVCYSKGSDVADWMTFRNQAEFDCLVGADKKLWTFQYQGPCIGNCPLTSKKVCGDDGQEWDNACQAKWYNGDSYTWKDGPCAP